MANTRDKIRNFLSDKRSEKVKDIAYAIGSRPETTAVILNRMQKSGQVVRIGHGLYSLVGNAKQEENIEPEINNKPNDKLTDDILDTLVILKKKYGRSRMLAILKKAQELFEE